MKNPREPATQEHDPMALWNLQQLIGGYPSYRVFLHPVGGAGLRNDSWPWGSIACQIQSEIGTSKPPSGQQEAFMLKLHVISS